HLSARIVQVLTERSQADVDRVQHDLDRHQHQDDVAPAEKSDEANREEDGAQPQARTDGHHQDSIFLLATTTAPTMAARRMRDAISKGSANRVVNNVVPIDGRLPSDGPAAAVCCVLGTSPGSRAYHARAANPTPIAAHVGQCAPNRGPAISVGRSRSI